MKVVIAQINPIPGDFTGNVSQIQEAISKAAKEGAQLVVMPEMSIPGYLCRDSMLNEGFVDMNLKGLATIVSSTLDALGVTVVVGYVDKNRTGAGKPFHNCAAVVRDGCIVATYRKQLLPFYDVFDEGRYFEPGTELTTVEIEGRKFGIVICEDLWNDKGVDDYAHHNNPVERYRAIGVRYLISLNSSPYIIGKPLQRDRMVNEITKQGGLLIYVNQVGGMDDLLFDGNSCLSINGTTAFACGDKKGNFCVDVMDSHGFQALKDGMPQLKQHIVSGLRDYVHKSGFKSVVVASSGGIDSALVLCLACEAFGPQNVHAIRMPSEYSSKGSVDDALALHIALGCHDYMAPINHRELLTSLQGAYARATASFGSYAKVADENVQARLRAINLMHFSNAFGAIALTTGNKSENATGYCTLGGDMMGGFAPIQDLYKTQVYEMSRLYKQIPSEILEKAPSAELAPDQKDEDSLLPYLILDLIIYAYIELRISTYNSFMNVYESSFFPTFDRFHVEAARKGFVTMEDAVMQYARIIRLIDMSEFKRRQSAPGIKVSRVAFGSGRRFPIARKRW